MKKTVADEGQAVRLYYYTGKQWGMKSLWEKRLKAARLSELNDPFELSPFDLREPEARSHWKSALAGSAEALWGVVCFSESWRSTLMWSQYGEKHTGICLGFDVPAEKAIKVRYVDKPKAGWVGSTRAENDAMSKLRWDALSLKYSGWSYEKEWRLPVPMSKTVDKLFFMEFGDSLNLREIILGVRCSLKTGDVVDSVVNPPLDVEIYQARAAHGEFDICRHEEADTHTRKGFRAALALAKSVYADDFPDD